MRGARASSVPQASLHGLCLICDATRNPPHYVEAWTHASASRNERISSDGSDRPGWGRLEWNATSTVLGFSRSASSLSSFHPQGTTAGRLKSGTEFSGARVSLPHCTDSSSGGWHSTSSSYAFAASYINHCELSAKRKECGYFPPVRRLAVVVVVASTGPAHLAKAGRQESQTAGPLERRL